MEMNVLPELLSIMEKDYQSTIVKPITYLINNMLAVNDGIVQYCLDLNVIHHLKIVLNLTENNNNIFVDILSSFVNIAAGNEHQISVIYQISFLCICLH